MKKIVASILFITFSINLFAQEFNVPNKYKFETEKDYKAYETEIIHAIEWMMKTPANEQQNKRQAVNKFVITWIVGSPTVHIALNDEILTFLDSSPSLILIFMSGWAKYSIETKDIDNTKNGTLAGIKAVNHFYNLNTEVLKNDKAIEKYVKLEEKGKLNNYIAKKVE